MRWSGDGMEFIWMVGIEEPFAWTAGVLEMGFLYVRVREPNSHHTSQRYLLCSGWSRLLNPNRDIRCIFI